MRQLSTIVTLFFVACAKQAAVTPEPTPTWKIEFALDQDHAQHRARFVQDSWLLVGDASSRDTKIISRIDPKTGKSLWTSEEMSAALLPSKGSEPLYGLLVSPTTILLRQLDPNSGATVKESSLSNPAHEYATWHQHDGQIFKLQESALFGFSPDSPTALWSVTLTKASGEPAFLGSSLLVSCQQTFVCQVSRKDGALSTKDRGAWIQEIVPLEDESGALILDTQRLSLTEENGSERWEKKLPAGWTGQRVVVSGAFVALLSRQNIEKKDDKYDTLLELLDRKDGRVLWSTAAKAKGETTGTLLPTLALSDEWLVYGLYAPLAQTGLWAHNIKTGEDIFIAPLKSQFAITTEFAGAFTETPRGDPMIAGSTVLFRMGEKSLQAYPLTSQKSK